MIVASNFKTNHTRKTTREFVAKVDEFVNSSKSTVQTKIYPTATSLDHFGCDESIKIGVQNFYPTLCGSFTGEIGFEQLEEFGVQSLLVGHSERRHILKESDELVVKKFEFAKKQEAEILYCVGEPKEVREAGIDAVMVYLWEQFVGIDLEYDRLVVAYEPVWAIGSGLSASSDDIKEVLKRLREKIEKPLLYGGSVKVSNIGEILDIENCDGVLVGTASWRVEDFIQMIKIAQQKGE